MSAITAEELGFVRGLALEAGAIVMSHFGSGCRVEDKGGEPVTAADRRSNELIVRELARRFPGDAILAEETPVEDDAWRSAERCWMVDPLDGTSDFIAGREGFAVMIGLRRAGRPALGVVCVPAVGRLFLGLPGEGAEEESGGERRPIAVSARASVAELRAIVSISHRDEALERVLAALRPAQTLSAGSVGYKAGKIAAGEADLYVAPSPAIRLWDTCAPEAILRAAGGSFLGMDGRPLDYAGPDLRHARGVLASNGACLAAVLDRLK